MHETAQLMTVISAAVAILIAAASLLAGIKSRQIIDSADKSFAAQKLELKSLAKTVDSIELDHYKKIHNRQICLEGDIKQLGNNIDLVDEKLRSYINRQNARLPRKKEVAEADTSHGKDQIDILEALKDQGLAEPLAPANAAPINNRRFVRASQMRKSNHPMQG